MKSYKEFFGSFVLMAVLILVAAGLQTSLWRLIFGTTLPAPYLWLPFFTYISLKWKLKESLILGYGASPFLIYFTGIGLGTWLFIILGMQGSLYLLKERLQWSPTGYNIAMTESALFLFHVFTFIFYWIAGTPQTFLFGNFLLQFVYMALLTPWLFKFLNFIFEKRLTLHQEIP